MADEVARRAVHASGATIPLAYVLGQRSDLYTVPWHDVRLLLVGGILLALALEAVRLLVGLEWVVFEKLTRHYEQDNLAGYALYVIGGGVAGLLFPAQVAVPAMLMLTLGDPVSGLLGSGELRTVKQPRVLATMFVVCAALAWPFLPLAAVVAAALAATLADGVKPRVRGYVVDDNLTIPLAASLAAWLALVATGEIGGLVLAVGGPQGPMLAAVGGERVTSLLGAVWG